MPKRGKRPFSNRALAKTAVIGVGTALGSRAGLRALLRGDEADRSRTIPRYERIRDIAKKHLARRVRNAAIRGKPPRLKGVKKILRFGRRVIVGYRRRSIARGIGTLALAATALGGAAAGTGASALLAVRLFRGKRKRR